MTVAIPPATADLRWDDSRLVLAARCGAQAAIELDGAYFSDVKIDARGELALDFAFAPAADARLPLVVRERRDGPVALDAGMTDFHAAEPFHARETLLAADAEPMRPEVAIVIPVYNAAEAVARCLASVLAHTTGNTRLIIIDDASSDPEISPLLARHADLPGVQVLVNPGNRGFTATVNRGIALAGDADVVLLNADTEVGPNWLTGLRRAAYTRSDIATVTAVSDNAGAFSVPELEQACPWPVAWSFEQTARALWQDAGHVYPALPTGNGFCLYIRRAVIDAIGLFDEQAFPQGYGEENDFCQRASARGWRHVIAGTVFVHHARSLSFGVERRQALGVAGMQVLRERWPNYETDVGATLFSFERRVLDWRVRRAYAAASSHEPLPRMLRSSPGMNQEPASGYDVWMLDGQDDRIMLEHCGDGAARDGAPVLMTRSDLGRWLQRHAIEIVDLATAPADALGAWLRRECARLGIAVVEAGATPASALAALRSFDRPTR